MMKKYIIQICCALFAIPALFSCNKFVEIPNSKNQIESMTVFTDSATAFASLLNTYASFASLHTNSKYLSLYADEYEYTSSATSVIEFGKSQLLIDNTINKSLWTDLYFIIYQCNSIIESAERSTGLSLIAKRQLKAEAKFLRAFANFYLVNLYDHIPLILNTNVNSNRKAFQSPAQLVYNQIIKDLAEAKNELETAYKGLGKVRANNLCATALLARVYLYQNRWIEAEREATTVINSDLFNPLLEPEEVFVANSREAILQFWTTGGFLTDIAQIIPTSATTLPVYTITQTLHQAFENTDVRKTNWIATNNVTTSNVTNAYSYIFKYKNRGAASGKPEYIMALRISEQYLIRAEARIKQNKILDAISDINIIRTRAGLLPLSTSIGEQACLDALFNERRLELFGEWGHRFFDLKRTNQLDATIGSLKNTWNNEAAKAFPIPNSEITYNPNLIPNHGY